MNKSPLCFKQPFGSIYAKGTLNLSTISSIVGKVETGLTMKGEAS